MDDDDEVQISVRITPADGGIMMIASVSGVDDPSAEVGMWLRGYSRDDPGYAEAAAQTARVAATMLSEAGAMLFRDAVGRFEAISKSGYGSVIEVDNETGESDEH